MKSQTNGKRPNMFSHWMEMVIGTCAWTTEKTPPPLAEPEVNHFELDVGSDSAFEVQPVQL